MSPSPRSLAGRLLALALALLLALWGCDVVPGLSAASGVPQYQQGGLVPVPGGAVNAAGGNLIVERLDLSIDTLLGTHEVRSLYDAVSGSWRWSFELGYDGATFVDASGAVHEVGGLADGAPIPGSVWLRVDADTLETRGGLAHHFDAAGRLASVAWRHHEHPRLRYAWSASRLEVSACSAPTACLAFLEVALDEARRPVAVTDLRGGRRAELAWDSLGRLVRARSPADVELGRPGFAYEYAPGGTLLAAITSSEGERIEYEYQAGRRILQVTQAGEERPAHRFAFRARDDAGLYASVHVDPLGARTRLVFDALRRLRRIEWLETGEALEQEWSGLRVSRRLDPDGSETRFTWVDDELVAAVEPSGNALEILHEPGAIDPDRPFARPVRRVSDSLGLVEERDYDASGRLVAIRNGEGEETAVAYHGGTTPASIRGPDGTWLGFPRYGVHGHWLEREGASPDRRAFDAAGNPRVPASQARGGGVLTRVFDADRRLAALHVAASEDGRVTDEAVVSVERRSDGRPLRILRPGGGDHEFAYDAIGRLVLRRERVDGAWQETAFERDAAGRVTARTRPNGMREEWGYDARGRLLLHRALRGAVLEGEALYAWSQGHLVSAFDSVRGSAEVYGYGAAGRLERVGFGYGEALELAWDPRSRPASEVFSLPGQGVILELAYEHDLADRLVAIRADGSEELLARAFADGRLVSTRYGSGLVRDLAYDPQTGLLRNATSTDAFGQVVEVTAIERTTEVGPPRSQVVTSTVTPLASTREEYWIGVGTSPADPDQRMGKRVFGWRGDAQGQGRQQAFAYDLLGNPADDADGDRFTANAERSRLVSASLAEGLVLDYEWDAAGFATARAGVPIAWTATGRLAAYGDVEIEWDMRGRPVRWTAGGSARDLSLFGGRIDRDPESGALGALDLGEVVVGFGGGRRFRHPDFRGNVGFVSDEQGSVVAHHAYAPYGVEAVFGEDAGVAFANGRALGGLVWLGARIYDPAVGRFLSPDPVFQLVNPYAYAMGNPVWFSDPDGTEGAPTGGDVAVDAVSLALATASIAAVTPATPVWVVGLAVLGFYWSATAFAVNFSAWRQAAATGASEPPEGEGPSGAEAGTAPSNAARTGLAPGLEFAAPAPAGCTPARLARVPDLGGWLWLLLPLQLLLGAELLRRRAAAARGRTP